MKQAFLSIVLAMLTFGYTSCASAPETSVTVDSNDPSKVFTGNDGLDSKVKLQNFLTRENNGVMEAQVDLFNTTNSNITLEYMFEWFDAQGFKIDNNLEHWTMTTVGGKHVQVITGVAPRAGAAKFRLVARNPQAVTR